MKYLKIQNTGLLDIRLIALMGGTTKADNPHKIGQFGTGLKYAISYLVRNSVKFYLFIGEEEVVFSYKEVHIGENTFKEIFLNGVSMNITTHYGYQWKAWEALREIWCNAKDEDGEIKSMIDNRSVIIGAEGKTTFIIEITEDIMAVVKEWDKHFLKAESIYEDDNVAIYPNTGDMLKLYKNGVMIQDSEYYKSLFVYDFKSANLNELRQYQGYLSSDVRTALLGANKKVIGLLLAAIADDKKNDLYEVKLDWEYSSFDTAHVKSIFNGWLFLHPSSDGKGFGKSVKVNESLFLLLKKAGLPTERISKSKGGYYGGGGLGYKEGEITYREVLNPELQSRINEIAVKYGSAMRYTIAVPRDGDFEILIMGNSVIFNSAIEVQSPADLEATVLIGIFHSQEHNVYKAFKRLIKYVMSNKNFRKILFGRNIIDKIKPTYVPPKDLVPVSADDDLLPF